MSRSRVSYIGNGFFRIAVFSFFLSVITLTATPSFAEQVNTGKPLMEKVTLGVQKLLMPFIANNGQVDERVLFYAQTISGTVFVTKDCEIVYALLNNSSELDVQSLESDGGRQRPEARSWEPEARCQKTEARSQNQIRNQKSAILNPKYGVLP